MAVALTMLVAAPLPAQLVTRGHAELDVGASFPAVYLSAPLDSTQAHDLDSAYVEQTRPTRWSWGTGDPPRDRSVWTGDPWFFYNQPRTWFPVNTHAGFRKTVGSVRLYVVAGNGRRLVARRRGRFYDLPEQVNSLLAHARPAPVAFDMQSWTHVIVPVLLAGRMERGMPDDWDWRKGVYAGESPLFPALTVERMSVDTVWVVRRTVATDGSTDSTCWLLGTEVAVVCRLDGDTVTLRFHTAARQLGETLLRYYPKSVDGPWLWIRGTLDPPSGETSLDVEHPIQVSVTEGEGGSDRL